MDYQAIINLMKEMNDTSLTKLEIESEGVRITLERGIASPVTAVAQANMSHVNLPVQSPVATVAQAPSIVVNENIEIKPEEKSGNKVVSPMVGTYYSQPSPDKPAFAKVGDKVKKGQTLCIIEAMKLMNEIESEYDGEVVDILVKNEQMVEYNQPLFIIK